FSRFFRCKRSSRRRADSTKSDMVRPCRAASRRRSTMTLIASMLRVVFIWLYVRLRHVPNWRWLLDRDDSPWYPSARLFRQPVAGDWESVVAKIIEELSLYPLCRGPDLISLFSSGPRREAGRGRHQSRVELSLWWQANELIKHLVWHWVALPKQHISHFPRAPSFARETVI